MRLLLRHFLFFLLFLVLTLVFYSSTLHAKFVFDFVDLYFDLKNKGWACLGSFSQGFMPDVLARGVFFGLIETIGLNEKIWFVLSSLLHSANALLVFLFIHQLLLWADYTETVLPALLSALLFLLSPFQTEVVVWGGAFNYLLVSFFILLHFYALISWIISGSGFMMVVAGSSFLLGLFSHEWGLFLLPADFAILILSGAHTKPKAWILFCLPLLMVGLYFFNQLLSGKLVGHYGAETHLRFQVSELVPAFYRYVLKATLLPSFVFEQYQHSVFTCLQKPTLILSLCLFTLITAAVVLFFFLKSSKKFFPPVLLLFLFILFVFPVLNLYFPYWIKIHADRYCYLPFTFLYAAVIALLFRFKTMFRILLPGLFLIASAFFLLQINKRWHQAAKLVASLQQNFPGDTTKQYYILNLPDTYDGAYMFRSLGNSKLAKRINMQTGIDRTPQITEVLAYNLKTNTDSVRVTSLSPAEIKVELSNPGSWWWMNTMGASDYENEKLKVDIDNKNAAYVVTLKKPTPNDVYLYQTGGEWRVFNQPSE